MYGINVNDAPYWVHFIEDHEAMWDTNYSLTVELEWVEDPDLDFL